MNVGIASRRADVVAATQAALTHVSGTNLCWVAHELSAALTRSEEQAIDVVLLDPELTSNRAADVIRRLLHCNVAAVMLVVRDCEDSVGATCEAMLAGAADVFTLQSAYADPNALSSRLATVGRLFADPAQLHPNTEPPLVALAASTGGPAALARVLCELPQSCAVVIVQHLDSEFASNLAHTLTEQSDFDVELVASVSRPTAGVALLAGRDEHLVMTKMGRFAYTKAPETAAHRPSADVLFSSLAAHRRMPGAAAVLTGMGNDGAAGLLALKRAGWFTIVQDQASSAVFGMPKAALKLGATSQTAPPTEIGASIALHLRTARERAQL